MATHQMSRTPLPVDVVTLSYTVQRPSQLVVEREDHGMTHDIPQYSRLLDSTLRWPNRIGDDTWRASFSRGRDP